MSEIVHLYALSDPLEPMVIRYIGKTTRSLTRRLSRHVFESRTENRTHKHRWILSLLREGRRPLITLLESVPMDRWAATERRLIALHRETLTNATVGGDGCLGLSDEARERISKAHRGRVISDEWRSKLAAANRGKVLTEEHRQKVSAGGRGLKRSAGTRARIAAAKTGTTLSAETRAKISAARRARIQKASKDP